MLGSEAARSSVSDPEYVQVLPDRVQPRSSARTSGVKPPPVPKKPDKLFTRSGDVPPVYDNHRKIWSPPFLPHPAASELFRADPHLYEEISAPLDRSQESDGGLHVNHGLLAAQDDLCDREQQEDQSRRVQRIRSGVQLYLYVLFHRGTSMMNLITQLNCVADQLDKTLKKTRIAGITGGTTGAIGATAVVAGIALAPATLGASLAVAGIGACVAAAGGVTGASAAISKTVKKTQDRRKVEKILRSYQSQMEEVEECLKFIISEVNHLRGPELGADAADVLKLAEQLRDFDIINALNENTRVVQAFTTDLNLYFREEDTQRLKKGSESLYAAQIRDMALKLKENIDHLIRIKNIFR